MRQQGTVGGVALMLAAMMATGASAQAPMKRAEATQPQSTPPAPAACNRRFGDALPAGPVESWIGPDDYPQAASRQGIGGVVRFRVNVGVTGRVENVEILESADPILTQATQRVLTRRARFRPAVRNCQPVPGEYEGVLRWSSPE